MKQKQLQWNEYLQSKDWEKKIKELVITPIGERELFNLKDKNTQVLITTNKQESIKDNFKDGIIDVASNLVVWILVIREFKKDNKILSHSDPNDKDDPTFAVVNNTDYTDERWWLVPYQWYQEFIKIIETKIEVIVDQIKLSEQSKNALLQTFLINKQEHFKQLFTYDFLKVWLKSMRHEVMIEEIYQWLDKIFNDYQLRLFEVHKEYYERFQKEQFELARNDVLYKENQRRYVDENNVVHDTWTSKYPELTIVVDELNSFRFNQKDTQLEQMRLFDLKLKEMYEILNKLNQIRVQESYKGVKVDDNQPKKKSKKKSKEVIKEPLQDPFANKEEVTISTIIEDEREMIVSNEINESDTNNETIETNENSVQNESNDDDVSNNQEFNEKENIDK